MKTGKKPLTAAQFKRWQDWADSQGGKARLRKMKKLDHFTEEDLKGPSFGWRELAKMPKGSTVYTVLRRVRASGMRRAMNVITIPKTGPRAGQPCYIRVMEHDDCALDCDQERRQGADYSRRGCGMDMGFDLVYSLGHLIHGDGYYFEHRWI